MMKKISKVLCLILVALIVLMSFGCKKKVKHKWIEVGAEQTNEKITPGVHPERGSESNAVKVILAPIYYPLGRDKKGVPQYKKYLYELEELTPEALDEAMKSIHLIDESSLFCDLVIEDADEAISAGPGAVDAQLTKKGTVRYVDLASEIDNSDEYEGKVYERDLEGMIDQRDIEHCITQTFEENFQLVSCDIAPVDMETYNKVHNKNK